MKTLVAELAAEGENTIIKLVNTQISFAKNTDNFKEPTNRSQCVAVCCSVLQCVAVCCSVLQCVAVCCSVLQCVAVCGSVL